MDARRPPAGPRPAEVLTTSTAEVVSVRPAGRFDVVGLTVSHGHDGWGSARPGQFVVEPRDPAAGTVRARVHWLAGSDQDPVHGTTAELVLPADRSTTPGDRMRLLGPLGQGFPAPRQPVPVLLVGHEGGAVPLRWLTARLRSRGCVVHLVLSADDPELHLDLPFLRRHARSVVLTTSVDLVDAVAGCWRSSPARWASCMRPRPRTCCLGSSTRPVRGARPAGPASWTWAGRTCCAARDCAEGATWSCPAVRPPGSCCVPAPRAR
ncbi:hypothetical protein BJF81_07025 [Ornithinimicrobium sp. CNJ-824]|uniref:hypothetical protein n=1 Tax=Ornithinimicrobium sp. CNJ-824 TaxID=1904966 RepID=UPI0009614D5E|nr:hypothetical protein [Ornithinimicrobium sp. CNJ-824]OLT19810.1 hypothetical protein BJF81_07025 [Ornithinimicrobium sp. CNJ-824]